MLARDRHLRTPDGRYFVERGRLWHLSDPALALQKREALVIELMSARRAVRDAETGSAAMSEAWARMDAAKCALGERGPPWWNDGAPYYNQHLARSTPFAAWFAKLNRDGQA